MTRQVAQAVIGILAILFAGFSVLAGDVFVSTRLEAQGGYENNPLVESGSGDGSFFWLAGPGIDVTLFGSETETALFVDYRRTQYVQTEFEYKDEASVSAQWRHFGGRNESGGSVGGGLYQDAAWPANDFTFWQARPYFVRTLESVPAEVSLKGTFRQTFYDVSAYTSATERVDSRFDVRPGARWNLSDQVTLWSELYAEHNLSDVPEAEYSGFGGAIGFDYRPGACLEMGAWAGYGTRSFSPMVEGEKRRDTPSPAGAWATYRLRPWLELFSSLDWESSASTLDGSDYSWWRFGCGLKLVVEHEAGTK
jgi:hypothetical protein